MRPDQALKRLQAWHQGKPLPAYETLHFPVASDEDVLILAFVRMGGESAPWGIACGYPGQKLKVFTVPEARNRDAVADMVATFSPIILDHFYSPIYYAWDGCSDRDPTLTQRQLWVPNPSHIEMLHHLAYSYTFTKVGNAERVLVLNAVGRLSGWLFRESCRPGQTTVMAGTDALRQTFVFPAEDVRQAHLGYLLGWLDTKGGRGKRLQTAQQAERSSVSTSLDPHIERDELGRLVEQWNDHRLGSRLREDARRRIGKALDGELTRRCELVERAIAILRTKGPRPNAGVHKLVKESLVEHWLQYLRLELKIHNEDDGPAFIPDPETDRSPAAAAARYFVHQHSEEFRNTVLIHDDCMLQEELLASGDAIRGEIVRVVDLGLGKKIEAHWTIDVEELAPLRIREGSSLCPVGQPKRELKVASLRRQAPGKLEVVAVVTNGKKTLQAEDGSWVPAANDPSFEGMEILLLPKSMDQISRSKGRKIWATDGPGSWITHAVPEKARRTQRRPVSVRGDDGGENLFEQLGKL